MQTLQHGLAHAEALVVRALKTRLGAMATAWSDHADASVSCPRRAVGMARRAIECQLALECAQVRAQALRQFIDQEGLVAEVRFGRLCGRSKNYLRTFNECTRLHSTSWEERAFW